MEINTKKLNIFSEYNYSLEGKAYEPILYPFWGKPLGNSKVLRNGPYPWNECFDNYIKVGKSIFRLSSLEKADVAIVPLNLVKLETPKTKVQIIKFLEKTRQAGKLTMSFFGGDHSHTQLPAYCDLVFRHSMYASTRKPNDFAMPAWGEDFIKTYFNGQIILKQKQLKPTVGFCGFSSKKNFKTYGKFILYETGKFFQKRLISRYNIGHVIRFKALSTLSKSSLVKTNFVLRDQAFFNQKNANSQKTVREEYTQNLIESDYVFCCRGYGNFSFRFYEALSCGRIPVFVNSDCVLPYDFEIDWKKYCVWVEENEISLIAEKVAEFHEKLQPQEFLDLQYECRKIWEQRLSPEGFYSNLYRHLPLVSGK
ncbi:exostosin domain-containing protein [Myxosarcina sp. GI1(2024)]